jgi:uncharacterized protein YkwD
MCTLALPAVLLALTGCSAPSLPSLGLISASGQSAASLNEFRVANGRSKLRTDAHLTSLASAHAADMARRNSLDHNGFMERRGPAGARAENVAYGCKDTPCVIRLWIKSSGHRKNMLRGDVSRYGLAFADAANGRRYWALELGE